ncbi:hypothetical protein ACQCTA_00790 [Bacillus subtilis]|uniref:hypothetical protein n=1 Tax=Bacillus subtilis TaxID=1423 RepID=UPI003CFA196C
MKKRKENEWMKARKECIDRSERIRTEGREAHPWGEAPLDTPPVWCLQNICTIFETVDGKFRVWLRAILSHLTFIRCVIILLVSSKGVIIILIRWGLTMSNEELLEIIEKSLEELKSYMDLKFNEMRSEFQKINLKLDKLLDKRCGGD